jgi:CDP-2,3-bis-(O-geranylgeranyl)-sn-glycerol synthase
MIEYIIQAIWFILPAYFANLMIGLTRHTLNFLAFPVDFNAKMGEERLFGKTKTFRGFVVASLAGMGIAVLQMWLSQIPEITKYNVYNYAWPQVLLFGFLLGFGAAAGDLAKSFIKRRLKIESGKSWMPFDQVDFVIGALLFVSIVTVPPLFVTVISLAIIVPLHMFINWIGYKIKFKDTMF